MPEWVLVNLVYAIGGMGLGAMTLVGAYRLTARWLDRRHEYRLSNGGGRADEIAVLRERLEILEETTYRLQDLEERVDFAERVLAKHSEPEQLPPVN
jgi:hypothetical protein